MFRLTKDECLRSQIVTLKEAQGRHLKYMPVAFTELGVAMLSSALRSKAAIEINMQIMRAFVAMRQMLHRELERDSAISDLQARMDMLQEDMEELRREVNDLSEETGSQMDDICLAMAELSRKTALERRERVKIGFKR